MTRLMRAGIALAVTGVLGWLGGCSDSPIDPGSGASIPQGVIVSNPVPAAGIVTGVSAAATARSAGGEVVYVSLAPGTAPTGSIASVRHVGDGVLISTAVLEGGFDPVPLGALVDDSVEVLVRNASGAIVFQATVAVRPSRPPVVVRTQPPPGKTDVPINAALVMVFSEPVNAATLNSTSVRLFRGSTAIAGTVSLLPGTATAAVFAPAAPLDRNTDYRLNVTRAVRDLQGDPLATADTVDFTTGTTVVGSVASVSLGLKPDTPATVVSLGSRFQLTATARDAQSREVVGHPVTWSSSDRTVVTVSASGLVTAVAVGQAWIVATVDGQSGQAPFAVTTIAVGTVTVTPESARVGVGGTVPLRAAVWDPNGQGLDQRLVTWSSSDPTVATVAPSQSSQSTPVMVTGVAVGITRISATVDGKSDTALITVVPVASVVVTPKSATVETLASIQLTATLRDGQGALLSGGPVAWTSDNPAVATVNASGLVTAVSGGVARVVASSRAVSDTATITVPGMTRRIAFTSTRDGNAELYAMNVDGSGLVRLTNHPATDQSPAWSPDGSMIAFVSYRDGGINIYTMNADGTGIVRLTSAGTTADLHPAWSPDGRRIAFESTRDGVSQIYVMNADGTGVFRLTYDTATVTDATGPVLQTYADRSPTWSPDGSRLAFTSMRDYQIYTIHADGTGMSRLSTVIGWLGLAQRLAWSPDGSRFVAAISGGIALVNADGSGAHLIVNNVDNSSPRLVATANNPAWSPDAARIVFARRVAYGGRPAFCTTHGCYWGVPPDSVTTSIQVMNADGTGVHTLTTSITTPIRRGEAVRTNDEPSWKP